MCKKISRVRFNRVQEAAYNLMQSDARFLYALTNISQNAKNINSNYMVMSLPYIGIFADGSEQWLRKMNIEAPQFTEEEKMYYTQVRQAHKLFEKSYDELSLLLEEKLMESDDYFYNQYILREEQDGYFNIGTDICNHQFCGNTILCAIYLPISPFKNNDMGQWLKQVSVIAGKLAKNVGCKKFPAYRYNADLIVKTEDYHFYDNSPLKMKNNLGLVLFSILCSINFVTVFIEKFFVEEIPQKFKFAYLQYYYLCDFIKELNSRENIHLSLDGHLWNTSLRNCIAHYGLGSCMKENDIISNDILKGLTVKTLGKDFHTSKVELYNCLQNLAGQINQEIFTE